MSAAEDFGERRARALVVDDAAALRHHAAGVLRDALGMEVTEAENGLQGLQRLHEGGYDLLVTDVEMPLLDGLKLTRLAREQSAGAGKRPLVIVVVTAATVDDLEGQARRAGADALLRKPVGEDVLVACVGRLGFGPATTDKG